MADKFTSSVTGFEIESSDGDFVVQARMEISPRTYIIINYRMVRLHCTPRGVVWEARTISAPKPHKIFTYEMEDDYFGITNQGDLARIFNQLFHYHYTSKTAKKLREITECLSQL